LDPESELKRIFGNAAVNVDRRESNRRNPHRNKQYRTGTIISRVNQAMPGGRGGLSMVEDEKKNNENIQWWRFTHNRDYQGNRTLFILSLMAPLSHYFTASGALELFTSYVD